MADGITLGRRTNAKFPSQRSVEFSYVQMSNPGSSNQADARDQTIAKKRRGRQPRPSLVSPSMQQAIAKFTSVVGGPVIQPGGFRDYTGWLESIASPRFQSDWTKLSQAFLQECKSVEDRTIPQLKKDVVTEIINKVVKKMPHESSKLVSTNARRQCVSSPSSGTTVMAIFETYLASVAESQDTQTKKSGGSASSSRSTDRHGSQGSAHRSGTHRTRSGSGMEISSLLVENTRPTRASSSSTSKLPPLSDFDEQIRARKERERDRSR